MLAIIATFYLKIAARQTKQFLEKIHTIMNFTPSKFYIKMLSFGCNLQFYTS